VKNSILPASKDGKTLPLPSAVSPASTNKDEDDLYSDDRHLWPSPMSQRSIRLVSSSPVAEETTEIVRDDSQSIENTTPQLSDDAFETSSIYSNDSARTAVFVGNHSKGTDSTPRTPVTARLREPLATPGEASPTRPGLPFSYSCASFNSSSSDRSPLTHFPISAEQRSRATTEDMVQGVITRSGGRLRYEETRQVQVVEGKHDVEIKASFADIWHTDDYMEPDLQPAPLNLSKKLSVTGSKDDEPEMLKGSMPSNDILEPIRQFIYKPTNSRFAKYASDDYFERPKEPYVSGFVPLPGSLLYEADKNLDIISKSRNVTNNSKAKSTISGVITPSKPSPARKSVQSEKAVYEPRASRSMNELHDTPSATSTFESLSELDEFFGVGPYEKAFLEKYPEAAKPFVLPPKEEESPASPVFTGSTFTAPTLRRRDLSIQQHRALPLNTVQRVLERKPRTSANVSSFALHRAQGNKATILPTLEGRSLANAANTRGLEIDIGQGQEYEDSISGEFPPQHALLDDIHRFSLQRYDISTRRPSSQARPSTFLEPPSPVSPCENVVAAAEAKKITNAPTSTLGTLFRRRNRNRNVRQPQALQTQQVPAPIATPAANLLSSPTPARTAKAAASTLTRGNRPSWKD
jgi:serine/arginine repetitive matrix protein 2